MRNTLLLAAAGLFLSTPLGADVPPPSPVQVVVTAQFGDNFDLVAGTPVLTGDFNGDGVEDAVFVATTHSTLQPNPERYRMLDPTGDFFGIGDPAITSQFANPLPGRPRYLLIVHGVGKDAWRSKDVKERFVIINLAFDKLAVGHVMRKKRPLDDIAIAETGLLDSFLYWTGKKYKWQPAATTE
jgi:hypothetical protein